ncbi:anthranilate synthase component I family protein [Rothia nasimurium]|uniref:anthranilate synthase component I family protein n=1 Tax=Rothia nasimurium TaxID=85336 RepID=UPI001F31D986|nr:anthranilate synthase component I family protein [Rothia nasimurium]
MTSLTCRALNFPVEPAAAFPVLAGGSSYAFWLDSARDESPMSRYSYLGAPLGGGVLRYGQPGRVELLGQDGYPREVLGDSIWQVLPGFLESAPRPELGEGQDAPPADVLLGGYVGFMGYEAHADLEVTAFHREHPQRRARTPDALWMPATHYLMYEHESGKAWLVGPADWVETMVQELQEIYSSPVSIADKEYADRVLLPDFPLPDRQAYLAAIATAQAEIAEGNSYEVCLTAETSVQLPAPLSPGELLNLYLAQRQANAAPYAAFLQCDDFTVLSSSPEKFLTVTSDGRAEAKPIKGTVPRGASPHEDQQAASWLASDPKTRAENLMIVDLLRNDLSMVSEPESVRVPVLMGVESYSTVHQLVSTIVSQLRPGITALDAVAACFPGGSMTGAPKAATMAIIDRLEGRARGVYSGALGYLGADGSVALSIVIRTLVAHSDGLITLAAGGAIVADSDPAAEYEEMVTKLKAATP